MFAPLLAIALLAAADSIAQDEVDCGRARCARARGRVAPIGRAPAFFEFAPTNGAGMGVACACATPTGAKGETMTFARASSATCLKTVGAAPQTIANGDMVTCSSGQPRVMPGTDGTTLNGVLNEGARTNLVIRSEEFSNVAWTVANSGSVNPVVTADQGIAPDGTMTADRVQFSACPASTNASFILQTGRGTSGSNVGSVYCRGTSISQTISVCAFDDGANLGACTQVVCPATGWVRASQLKTIAATTGGLVIGCNNASNYVGAASTGAADVLLSDAQYEAGTYASSYIKTVAASAARVAETATFAGVATSGIASTGSAALTFIAPSNGAEDSGWYLLTAGGTARFLFQYITSTNVYVYDGTNLSVSTNASYTAGVAHRYWSNWSGSTMSVNTVGGSSASGTFTGPMTVSTLALSVSSVEPNGVVKQVCLSPDPSRCR